MDGASLVAPGRSASPSAATAMRSAGGRRRRRGGMRPVESNPDVGIGRCAQPPIERRASACLRRRATRRRPSARRLHPRPGHTRPGRPLRFQPAGSTPSTTRSLSARCRRRRRVGRCERQQRVQRGGLGEDERHRQVEGSSRARRPARAVPRGPDRRGRSCFGRVRTLRPRSRPRGRFLARRSATPASGGPTAPRRSFRDLAGRTPRAPVMSAGSRRGVHRRERGQRRGVADCRILDEVTAVGGPQRFER